MSPSDYILEYHKRGDRIEKLREGLMKIERHGPIMGSTGEYRQGQIDILETVSTIASLVLAEDEISSKK